MHAEPDTDDFKKVSEVFDRAVADLRKAGAEIVDPIVIPDLKALLAKRARSVEDDDADVRAITSRAARRRSRRAPKPWPRRCSRRSPTAARDRWTQRRARRAAARLPAGRATR